MADGLLRSFPPDKELSAKEYDHLITTFLREISQIPSSTWQKPVNNQNVLDVLDPAVNSLPYIAALNSQLGNARDDEELVDLVSRTNLFLSSFDATQIRYDGASWHALLDRVLRLHESQRSHDLRPIVSAVLRLDPTAGTFTVFHLRLLRLCIGSGVPLQALPILDRDIYAFPQVLSKGIPDELISEVPEFSSSYINLKSGFTTRVSTEHVLEFYLLGAQIYLGVGNFNRARLFLEYILLTPSFQHTVSALQVEAFKKWTLSGLLAEGRAYVTPKTIDQGTLKGVRALSKAYETLAESFEKRDSKKFQADMEKGTPIWQEDGNTSLVKEAAGALLRYRIQDLKRTYAALPVKRVAAHLDIPLDATLQLLAEMDSLGTLHAIVTGHGVDAVVKFDQSTANSEHTEDLEAQTKRLQLLVSYIHDVDRRLQLTKEFTEHQKRQKRNAGPDGDLADAMDLTYDAAPIDVDDGDEDIMN